MPAATAPAAIATMIQTLRPELDTVWVTTVAFGTDTSRDSGSGGGYMANAVDDCQRPATTTAAKTPIKLIARCVAREIRRLVVRRPVMPC
ncbi:MAG: hypothetical protein QOH52_4547, partial [Pseudonocardiales bacterium]|nr:hypothetical protein [Pseudonocardiales bacterium]